MRPHLPLPDGARTLSMKEGKILCHPLHVKASSVAAIVGVAGTLFYLESQPKRPSRVLAEVKAEFAKQGPIEGSWIHYVPVEYPELESQPQVYIGGISRYEGEQLVHYQFVCDIYTGQILDLFPVEG